METRIAAYSDVTEDARHGTPPFAMIIQTVHYSIVGPYMVSYGLVAGLNLDLWLNQAWGGKPRIETRF